MCFKVGLAACVRQCNEWGRSEGVALKFLLLLVNFNLH